MPYKDPFGDTGLQKSNLSFNSYGLNASNLTSFKINSYLNYSREDVRAIKAKNY